MFLIYEIVSFLVLFAGILKGSITPLMGQIWVLTTLSVGALTYGLETKR